MYRLMRNFTVSLTYPGGVDKITVPAGYETDFASIPVIFSLILGPCDNYAEEAVVHDWLCEQGLPGWYVDSKMRSIMTQLERAAWKKLWIFWGLRFFGWSSPVYKLAKRIKAWIINSRLVTWFVSARR